MAADLLAAIVAEIEARRDALRPAAEEYKQLLSASTALGIEVPKSVIVDAAVPPAGGVRAGRKASVARKAPVATPPPSAGGEARQAIVAALEHGSHTVSELAVVTAMSGGSIRESVRGLIAVGAVTRARRADGKAAYALVV
jgi:hypothetical protein